MAVTRLDQKPTPIMVIIVTATARGASDSLHASARLGGLRARSSPPGGGRARLLLSPCRVAIVVVFTARGDRRSSRFLDAHALIAPGDFVGLALERANARGLVGQVGHQRRRHDQNLSKARPSTSGSERAPTGRLIHGTIRLGRSGQPRRTSCVWAADPTEASRASPRREPQCPP